MGIVRRAVEQILVVVVAAAMRMLIPADYDDDTLT